MNKNQNIAKAGEVFIIPNSLSFPENFLSQESEQTFEEKMAKFGLSDSQHIYVQCWCVTPGCTDSNWSCHHEMAGGENFAEYLPISLFEGKKEGDTVVFPTKWGMIQLTLKQQSYRYRSYGSFEVVLSRLKKVMERDKAEWAQEAAAKK